nr:hypothetical protein [Tanacetum cinerariifolium]
MQTRSSSKPYRDQTSNPTSSTNPTPKGRIRRSSKQKVENSHFEEHLTPVATMTDNRTMAEMLRAARRWLEKEPPRSITTWDDLQKFDESFHEAWKRFKDLLRACPHHGFNELHQLDTFYNALNPADQDSLNAAAGGNLLEKSPQDALTIIENKSKVRNSRSKPIASPVNACDISSNSEIAKLTHAVNQQTSVVTTAMTAMLKQLQANPPPAQVKAVKEICVTCGAAGNYNQGNPGYRPQGIANPMRPPGFAQPNVQNNQNRFGQPQGFNRGLNFNQEHDVSLKATTQSNQNFHLNELEKIKRMNDVSLKAMQNQIDMVKNKLRNEMKTSIQTSLGLVTDGPTVPTPPKFVTPEEDECVKETYTDPDLAEYTIKQEKDDIQIQKFWNMFKQLHLNITLAEALVLMPKYQKMLKALLFNKEKLQELANTPLNENCSAVILKKLLEKLGDPGKFLILCGFSLPDLIPTRMTLELTNRAICTPDGIARDVFVPVGKFTFPADFVVIDYESDPRVPLILGRPFLKTARALIHIHGEEMILCDEDERLTLNMKHDTTSYSNHPHRESVNLINIFNILSEDCLEDLVSNKQSGNPTFSLHKEITSPEVIHEIHDSARCNFLSEEFPYIDSFNDIHPHFDDDPLSGSTTYSSHSLLEEFTDELALITYPLDYDDNLKCDIESGLREIEFLLYQGEDSDLKDSIDKTDLTNLDDLFVDPTPEMFTDEQPPDYSFPSRFDVYPNDFLEIESDADNFYDDIFDSKGEKIKEAKLLIDQLDLPCDILPEYDSFASQNFSRDDDLPSPDNEDKVFNPGILIHEKSVTIITRVAQEKKLEISYASLLFEDFDPPFYELLVFKEFSVLDFQFLCSDLALPGTLTTPAIVRDRTYDELPDAEKIHEGCDIKAIKIMLQGLPQDICNLPEWSKFVTDVKLATDLHNNFDHLYGYLRQHEAHANEEIPTQSTFQTDDLDAFDSDCNEAPSASVVLMAKISSHDYETLSQVPTHDNYLDNHVIDHTIKSNMISYEQCLNETEITIVQDTSSSAQHESMIMSIIEEMHNQVAKCIKHFVPQKQLCIEQAFWLPISKPVFEIPPVQPEPVLKEIPRELPTISLVKDSFNKMRSHVNDFENVITIHTKVASQNEGSWGFEHIQRAFDKDTVVNSLAEILDYKSIEKSFLDEHSECVKLRAGLSKKNDMAEKAVYDKLSKRCARIENICISLEIKELLVFVSATCPSLIKQSEKLIAVTPRKTNRKVRVISSSSASGSKPRGNTKKKNRISRPTSSNQKNKVEDYLRSVKSSLYKKNRVFEPVCNTNVKHSILNANSELICATCNECIFDAIHDLCVLDYVNDVNVRVKSKSVKSKKKKD